MHFERQVCAIRKKQWLAHALFVFIFFRRRQLPLQCEVLALNCMLRGAMFHCDEDYRYNHVGEYALRLRHIVVRAPAYYVLHHTTYYHRLLPQVMARAPTQSRGQVLQHWFR